jgi:hypothetical protein
MLRIHFFSFSLFLSSDLIEVARKDGRDWKIILSI